MKDEWELTDEGKKSAEVACEIILEYLAEESKKLVEKLREGKEQKMGYYSKILKEQKQKQNQEVEELDEMLECFLELKAIKKPPLN